MSPTLHELNTVDVKQVPHVTEESTGPRRGRPAFSHKDAVWVPSTKYQATVSQVTKDRLFNEAKADGLTASTADPRYADKTDEEIRIEMDRGLRFFLRDYPWWYGHLDIDQPKQTRPRTEAQLLAFEKLQQAGWAKRAGLPKTA